jgi:outer membrane protein TolC
MQLGERTMLDLLDGEQELLQSELDLVRAYRDLFNSYYEILFYTGELNSKSLGLSVNHFDNQKNFNEKKYNWLVIVE